ncbi:ABC transporter substrate-binding protein [Domibacillus iocasae]|uniref:SsuA/THI5-like domain-containing protein n=1 Tax=Domibacillus iocasae TaxID=1714016 RepID=A0A1E7DNV5_9BACI|nr:ABC transporter substrate-binding protein [Domibacillus iocasae]OES44729.1 hypothetical protein BA724_05490 [Domibacillus iocasae]
MNKLKSHFLLKGVTVFLAAVFMLTLIGCVQKENGQTTDSSSNGEIKRVPDERTEVIVGLPSKRNTSYLPLYVAAKKGYYQKKNLDVKFTYVQGGVLALRGLQTGDFHFISSLPESVITGVAEGANVKIIGTLDNQSMYSIYLTKDIEELSDLKGKNAAGMVTGNGTNIQLEYWLQKQGLEPNKDVRILNAGDNAERLQALQQGQASVTILSPPTDLKADELNLKRFLMRDELKTYNHNMVSANGDIIKNQPEVVYAFMDAHADAVKFIKNDKNRDEVIQILMDELQMKKTDAEKSFEFVLPALADKGKINMDGVKWAMDTVKEAKVQEKNVPLDQLVDERFYAE